MIMKPSYLVAAAGIRRVGRSGFSLVEVVVAVAIASSVLVALIGLLSFGMVSMRDAEVTTVEAQLVEKIFSELQGQQEWGRLTGKTLYFDKQGMRLSGSSDADYAVKVNNDSGRQVSLPGSPANPYLRYVTLQIGQRPGGNINFSADPTSGEYREYSTILADLGRR
ncbi:hypothetical protein BH23VER1_BH23VER1_03090 [soil metagenome]